MTAQNAYGISSRSDVGNGAIILTNPSAPVSLIENQVPKSATTIGMTWQDGFSNGGIEIIDYRVSFDQGTGLTNFVILADALVLKEYVATGLTSGTTYTFKVQARNSFGFSLYSTTLKVLCAFVPEKPVAPVSTIETNTVVLTWTAPYDNGSPLTKYTIGIKDSQGNYLTTVPGCDGTSTVVITARKCVVALADLTSSPFNLELGDEISVRIMAHNIYGASLNSEPGSGANIVLVPDAPINFSNVPSITTASRIGLKWTPGASSGDKPIIDYRIYYDQSTDNWVELANGVSS